MRRAQPLTCAEVVERLTDHLESALSAVELRRVRLHLSECAGCAAYLVQLRTTVAALGALRLRRRAS